MQVDQRAENGELRVLLYDIGRAKVAAGGGEILSIATTGGGKVRLESVEAAAFDGGALSVDLSAKVVPSAFTLHQNYPNPFNPATSFAIDFPTATDYTLTIYNITGQVVRSYNGHTQAGKLTLHWDGTNEAGLSVASGVYFYRVDAGKFSAVRKMVLMK